MKNKILYRREALIKIQKTVRGYLVKKKHKPRIKGIIKIKGFEGKLTQLNSIANQLKTDKSSSINEINSLKNDITFVIKRIKVINNHHLKVLGSLCSYCRLTMTLTQRPSKDFTMNC